MPAKTETDEADQRPLSESMNAATRAVHAKLNKLVISRLSLALPPKAEDASNYVSGLLHITPIYIAFESLWNNILQSATRDDEGDDVDEDEANRDPFAAAAAVLAQPCNICDPDTTPSEPMDLQTLPGILDYEGPAASSGLASVSALQPRMRTVLTALRVPGLARAAALQRDVVALTGWSRHTVAEHLDDAAESPVLAEFLHHVRHAVAARPHVLVAYAWVLYMALFSGGRVIRASLERVHPAFWVPAWASASPTSARRHSEAEDEGAGGPPLRFFSFDTAGASTEHENGDAHAGADANGGDGEALKATFKRRLAETEGLLTADERDDVADEALAIFVFLVRVVEELDDICDTEPQEAGGGGILALRTRDSVVVKKERRALALMARRVAAEQEQEAAREQGREREKGKEKGNGKGRGSRGGWRGKIDKVIPGRRSDV